MDNFQVDLPLADLFVPVGFLRGRSGGRSGSGVGCWSRHRCEQTWLT